MTTQEDEGTEEVQRQQQAVDDVRRVLGEGFAYVRGAEITAGIASLSFDEMVARAIKEITEDETDIRPCKLTIVRRVRQQVQDALTQARNLPPEMFSLEGQEGETNTDQGESNE